MLSASGLLGNGPLERWYLDGGPCPERLVYQIESGDEDHLVRAAALLDAWGREHGIAGIDVNMGCSAPAINRKGGGVRWMAYPDRAEAMMEAVRKVVHTRLSVKLRLAPERGKVRGLDTEEAVWRYFLDFCRRLVNAGVELIVLHPRTADEKFRRLARWEYVVRLKEALTEEGLPVLVGGNGDIDSAEKLVERSSLGLDLVMVGREAVRRPWIFARAGALAEGRSYEAPNIEETGLRFLDLLARYQPPEFHLSRARRFFSYFCDNLKWANYLKNQLNHQSTLAAIAQTWTNYFQ
jgi:tRNA-dihydrouridine synthase